MLTQPRKPKFTKIRKNKTFHNIETRVTKLKFGTFGLKALESKYLTSAQIEASRVAIIKKIKKVGRFWIRVFPDFPNTQKSKDSRMGKGRGNISHWKCRVLPGKILFEIDGVSASLAYAALHKASTKIPFLTKIIFL